MPKIITALLAAVLAVTSFAACNNDDGDTDVGAGDNGGGGDTTLVVYSGRNENLVRPILEQFEQETGIRLSVRYGDTAELAPTLLEEGRNARADVFFSQDAGALAALDTAGLLRPIPDRLLDNVDKRFRDPDGRWTGVTARARVVVYNTDELAEADLPASVLGFTDPAWRGRLGIAPTNSSFVAYVSALIEQLGEPAARQFLEGLRANDVKRYDNNTLILEAVASGEIDAGLANHYYRYSTFKERPDAPVANHFSGQGEGGEGTFINIAGVGILQNTTRAEAAERLVAFLLSRTAQEFFRNETSEYPLAAGVEAIPELPPLATLRTIEVPLDRLGRDLNRSLELIKDVGLT